MLSNFFEYKVPGIYGNYNPYVNPFPDEEKHFIAATILSFCRDIVQAHEKNEKDWPKLKFNQAHEDLLDLLYEYIQDNAEAFFPQNEEIYE